jgi:uncharacterized cupredoxin-like copper-binding protein
MNVTMTDFAFSPNVYVVPAGAVITVSVTNTGAVPHSLVIMKLGHELAAHGSAQDADIFWQHGLVDPGTSSQSTFTAPAQPGSYQILCGVAGHLEAGMVARLVVEASP